VSLNRNTYSLLIIEDNTGDFVLLETYLQEQFRALTIVHATNFKKAKEALLNPIYHFDAVLLDLSLPDKSGQSLIDEILSLCKTAPVIVLTGYGDLRFGAMSLGIGISDYLQKDELSPALLYKSIIYSLERKKALDTLRRSLDAIALQNKQLKDISWIQSHKVRAPVAKILGLVSLLGEVEGPVGEVVGYLAKSASELDQAIRSISKKIEIQELNQLNNPSYKHHEN
jgi:DNA-binding NarL/FixJ family response regulator